METTIKIDVDLLKKLLQMETRSLYKYLAEFLSSKYSYVDVDAPYNSFLYAHGDIPLLIVAHLDTVYDLEYNMHYLNYQSELNSLMGVKRIYHDREQGVLWSPDGLGGDDRVGVYMIIQLISQGLRPSVLFTTDEEVGSQSGLAFTHKYADISKHLGYNYIMQLDRAGSEDCVFYQCDNPEFVQYIESFGFKEAKGSFTDIVHICPVFKIAGVNLSVGYENEHSQAEMINLFTMSKNYDIIFNMVEESKKIQEPFQFIPKKKRVKTRQAIGGYECLACGVFMEHALFAPEIGQICSDCYQKFYQPKEKEND